MQLFTYINNDLDNEIDHNSTDFKFVDVIQMEIEVGKLQHGQDIDKVIHIVVDEHANTNQPFQLVSKNKAKKAAIANKSRHDIKPKVGIHNLC